MIPIRGDGGELSRNEGIDRWQDWFCDHLSSRHTVQELGWRGTTMGAVWKIGFPDEGEGKVYVAPEALTLDGDGFEDVVSSLDPVELVTRLRENPHCVLRIRKDGTMEALD